MLARLLRHVLDAGRAALSGLRRRVLAATKPVTAVPLVGALADLRRSKSELVAENAYCGNSSWSCGAASSALAIAPPTARSW